MNITIVKLFFYDINMAVIFDTPDIVYKTITPEFEKAAVTLVARIFASDEPLAIHCKIPQTIMEEFAYNILDNYLGREISIVCIHKSTQEVIGVVLSHGFHPDIPERYSDNVKNVMKPLFQLFDALHERFLSKYNLDPRLITHQIMGAVDRRFKGKKVAYNMMMATMEAAKSKGLTIAVAEPTGPLTQFAYVEILKFNIIGEIAYEEFEVDGVKTFENMKGCCQIIVKPLRLIKENI